MSAFRRVSVRARVDDAEQVRALLLELVPTGIEERAVITTVACAADAPRAVASSPSGWKVAWPATGPTMMGANIRSPASSTVRSRFTQLTIILGRSVMRSNGARSLPLSARRASPESTRPACASYSNTFTSSSLGASRGRVACVNSRLRAGAGGVMGTSP